MSKNLNPLYEMEMGTVIGTGIKSIKNAKGIGNKLLATNRVTSNVVKNAMSPKNPIRKLAGKSDRKTIGFFKRIKRNMER